MSRISQQQLESYLWGAATLLRGTIDAGDYKQFIFPLLFFKRLCDVFDEETQAALKESGGDKRYAAGREQHRFQIPADAHWRQVRKEAKSVGAALQTAMRTIETANADKLFGIFGDAQWTNKDRLSDAMLRDLIEHFSSLELTVANLPEDELGNGYEYLIKKFADDSGHTAAEFYTNRTVVHLMTEILQPQPGDAIYDPTCGSGGMLLSCVAHLRRNKQEWRNVRLYGQERNLMTSSIARMNCFLHGLEDFQIVRGDTLSDPKLVRGDRLMQFDVALANPPYSIKQWDRDAFGSDPWGRNLYGTPPQGRADYAFWQHILCSLKPKTGRCAILYPHGVLFRQEEADMRRKLVDADLIDCVIGLGPNLFYNSPMEACVVICRTSKPKVRKNRILFINAVDEVTRERAQSFLTDEHIARIVGAYKAFKDESGFTRVAALEDIRAKDANLSIPLYVSPPTNGDTPRNGKNGDMLPTALSAWLTGVREVRTSLSDLLAQGAAARRGTGNATTTALDQLRPIADWVKLPLFKRQGWSRVRFGDMVENVNERVEPADATEEIYVGLDDLDSGVLHIRRWGKGSDVIGTKLRFRTGDVIFGRRRAYQRKLAVADVDGICSAHAMVVRAKPDKVLPEFLPFLMMSDKFMNRAVEISIGSLSPTINWTTMKLEEFDLPPLDQQRRIAEALWAVDEAVCLNEGCVGNTEDLVESLRLEMFSRESGSRPIGECCAKLGSGKTPRGGERTYLEKGVMFLRSQNVHPDGLRLDDVAFISPDVDAEMKSTRVVRGDVLLNITGASIGRCTMFDRDEPANVNQHVCILRANRSAIVPQYLANYLQSTVGQKMIATFSTKGNREGLNFQQLGSIPLPLCDLADQEAFCSRVNEATRARGALRVQVERLQGVCSQLLNNIL